ncbi:uncharacterized protein LOC113305769 [Papaver somniferum]|uniref:uncharacterized protein LOC113305769 n=1 Tax=Papaver somniferum TaxID=3469 RepID=UPI000E6F7EB5|nr:uncharacterized protein LOC113305769 [Papaver somniferum]
MGASDIKTVKDVLDLVQRNLASSEDRFTTLEDKLLQKQQKADSNLTMINKRFDEILSRLPSPSRSKDDSGGKNGEEHPLIFGTFTQGGTQHHCNRVPKLGFPRFDGDNPRCWIHKCDRYFFLHNIDESRCMDIKAIYLDVKSDKWFLNFQVGRARITWYEFAHGIFSRFENPVEENFIGSFNKLVQLNSVEEYFEEFKALKALMLANNPSLSEHYFIMSFISGLKEELRNSVAMFYPKSLTQAFSLARMEEQKCQSISSKSIKPSSSYFTASRAFSTSSFPPKPISTSYTTSKSTPTTPKAYSPTPLKPASANPIIKRLTQDQMRIHRDKSLCYNCDEVYSTSYRCKVRQQLFMVQAENSDSQEQDHDEEVFEESVDSPIDSDMEISLHAITGTVTGDTIRIPGLLKSKSISILIDTGSTTSFLDCSLATKLKCRVEQTAPMLVTVANGEKTMSTGICSKLHWSMQGYHFTEDLILLTLGGCDMVLGANWLKKLGDIVSNFPKLSVSFLHLGHHITLQGTTTSPSLLMMSGSVVKKFLEKTTHGLIGHLFSVTSSPIPPPVPPPILPLLSEFNDIFAEPSSLPPHRTLDHSIPLKPGAQPPNQIPYRCLIIYFKCVRTSALSLNEKYLKFIAEAEFIRNPDLLILFDLHFYVPRTVQVDHAVFLEKYTCAEKLDLKVVFGPPGEN